MCLEEYIYIYCTDSVMQKVRHTRTLGTRLGVAVHGATPLHIGVENKLCDALAKPLVRRDRTATTV